MATQFAFGKIVTDGLVLALDAADKNSYPGSGTTWRDLSGNNNNGTLTNGPTFSSTNGGSIVFDNIDDYVNLGTPSTLAGLQVPLTICLWAKIPTTDSYDVLYSAYGSVINSRLYSMLRLDSGVFRYFTSISNGSFQQYGTLVPITNVWNFYAVTVSGTLSSAFLTMYLNTSSQGFSLSALSTTPDLTVPIRIGANGSGTEPWNGNIASCSVYNRALSASEILQNYNAQKSRFNL
jgi:hypothetical protein